MPTVATPTISPAAGEYDSPISVAIACATGSSTIFYTTDDTDPAEANGWVNTVAVNVKGTGYVPGDSVVVTGGDGLAKTTVATVHNGILDPSSAAVYTAGTGYAPLDTGHVLSGGGNAFYAVDTIADGVPDAMAVAAGGQGYTTSDHGTIDTGDGQGVWYVTGVTDGIINANAESASGSGYAPADTGTIDGGTGGTFSVDSVINGYVNTASVAFGGANYSHGDTVLITGGDGLAELTIDTVDGGGAVLTFSGFVAHGSGYTAGTKATTTGGGGDGNLTVTITVLDGVVDAYTLTAPGSGYSVAVHTTTANAPSTGTGFSINVTTVIDGRVISFNSGPFGTGYAVGVKATTNIVDTGSGFTINITSVLNGRIATFHLTNPGFGYTIGVKSTDDIVGAGTGFTIGIASVIDGEVQTLGSLTVHGSGYTVGTKATTTDGAGDNTLTVDITILNGVALGTTQTYSVPFTIGTSKIIKALGYKSGSTNSAIAAASYIIISAISGSFIQIYITSLLNVLGKVNPFDGSQQTALQLAVQHLRSDSLTKADLMLLQSLLNDKVQELNVAGPIQAGELAAVKQALADIRSLI